jgi:hypothetical protein
MGLIFNGRRVKVLGLESVDFLLDSKFGLQDSQDSRARRTRWIRGITLHTRMGIWPQDIVPGGSDRHWDEVLGARWGRDGRTAGAHVAVDADGSFGCLADLISTTTHHAGQVNDYTVGIEMYQAADGRLWEATLTATILICDAITRTLGIQRQFTADRGLIARLASPVKRRRGGKPNLAYKPGGLGGADFCGLYGHRNCTGNRGRGDPGDEIWRRLQAAGYEPWEVDMGEDLQAWAARQAELGFEDDDCDGIPGPMTLRALKDFGKPHGLWVSRPGD